MFGTELSHVVVDAIGDFMGDPGSGWDVAGTTEATKDHVLIRKSTVTQGNPDWASSAGTDVASSEWTVMPVDTWTDLGLHTFTGSCGPVVSGCMNPGHSNIQ
mgnify:FL=1